MIVELLIVITVIGILSGLAFVGITDGQTRARDTERAADIDTLHSRLEEHFTDKGGYPETLSTDLFSGLDPQALVDPRGNTIDVRSPVANLVTAMSSPDPQDTGANYAYIPYPEGCAGITCRGYVLKSVIEKPTDKIPNPYIRTGLHNN